MISPFYAGCICIAIILLSGLSSNAQCSSDFSFVVHDSSNTVYFANQSLPLSDTAYSWSFGDSSTSFQKSPVHTYPQKGTYQVCMKRTSSICSNVICKTLQVLPDSCALGFTYTIESGRKIRVFNHSAGTPDAFEWIWGDAIKTIGQRDAVHSYTFESTFNVCLNRKEVGSNCGGSICKPVHIIRDTCLVSFYETIDQETKTVRFHNFETSSDSIFTWTFGDNTSSREASPVHTYAAFGTYTVCLVNNNTSCSDTLCKTLVIDGRYPCYGSFTHETDTANPRLVRFKNHSKGRDLSYRWSVEHTGATANTKDFSYQFPQDGYYNVCLKVQESDLFCNSSICERIFIYSDTAGCLALFNYQVSKDSIANGTHVKFINQSAGIHKTSTWNFGDGSSSNEYSPTHTYNNSGTFTVYLAVYDTLVSCSDTLYQVIPIKPDTITSGLSSDPVFQELQFYPVPLSDKLSIKYTPAFDEMVTVKIINMLGSTELIETHFISGINNQIVISTSQLCKGVYLMELSTNGGSIIRKLIK